MYRLFRRIRRVVGRWIDPVESQGIIAERFPRPAQFSIALGPPVERLKTKFIIAANLAHHCIYGLAISQCVTRTRRRCVDKADPGQPGLSKGAQSRIGQRGFERVLCRLELFRQTGITLLYLGAASFPYQQASRTFQQGAFGTVTRFRGLYLDQALISE